MDRKIKIGSLFDGSGGFPLAGSMCGFEPVWAAEVEPYPIAVTRSRFPNMKHLGSVTDIHGGKIEPVDVVTFGSPCQDLSIAGKRAGLKHENNGDDETTRSGLFMEAVRIIKEMREATNGVYPAFAVFENVPGAFSSSKGESFRIILEELIKIVEPQAVMPEVPAAGWAYADRYIGDGWSLAYRVFDAQYWGVPQRRGRIYLVADFRGERAGEILFKPDGLQGHFAQGRTPWQGIAADAENCAGADDREGEGIGADGGLANVVYAIDQQGGKGGANYAEGVMPTLCSDSHGTPHAVAYSFDSLASNSMKSKNPHSGCREVEVAKTLDTTDPNPSKNQGGIAVVEQYLFENHSQDTRYKGPLEVSPMLPAQLGTGGNNTPFVVEETPVYCLQGNGIDRADTAGCNGKGVKEDICYTLNTIDRPAVAFQTYQVENAVRYIVRRLTPTECARLQGFPDRWGYPDIKEDFSEEEYAFWLGVRNTHASINGKAVKNYTKAQMLTWYNKLHTDSSEYKMWGNGIALPCALYAMEGIEDAIRNTPDRSESNRTVLNQTESSNATRNGGVQSVMKQLKLHRNKLSRQQIKTIRGQALRGDLDGAKKGIARLIGRNVD